MKIRTNLINRFHFYAHSPDFRDYLPPQSMTTNSSQLSADIDWDDEATIIGGMTAVCIVGIQVGVVQLVAGQPYIFR